MLAGLKRLLAAGAGVALLTGAAMAQSGTNQDIRFRLDQIQAELTAIRAKLGADAGTFGGESLEAEIARLTNEVEQLRHRIDSIAADATQRFGDIEFRLTELEGGDISELGPTRPLGESGFGTGTGPQVAATERRDLDAAVTDLRDGRYDQADERLRRFLIDYPGSPLTGEAQYWIGENLFVRGFYQDAARAYLASYQADRAGTYAPKSLLRLGASLGRLGQVLDACSTLREVPRQFPMAGPDVLDDADAEARRLGCS